MAVKFSQFTQESVAADVTEIVGYSATGDLNVRIPPANLDTTYSLATAQDGSNVDLTLTGAKTGSSSTSEVLQFTAGSGVTLTAGTDEITIASDGVDGSGTANTITKWVDADTIGDSIMSETAAGGQFTDPYISVGGAGGGVSTQNLEINGFLLDSNGQKGTTGQILSSTGTLTDWITLPPGDTYSIGTSTNGSGVDVNLDAAAGADSNITLTPVGGITITQAADVITIDSTAVNGTVTSVGTTTTDIAALTLSGTVTTAGDLDLAKTGGTAGQYIDGAAGAWTTLPAGDTYTLQAGAKSGTSVPLNLDAATGSDSVVNLTEGTGITLTQTSATEITIESAGGSVIYVDSFTGNGSTLTFTASQTIDNVNDTQVFIDGVNQSKSTYSTSGTSLIFSTAPPLNSNIELNNISSVSLVSVPDGVITTAKFSSGTLVTESEGIANNDNDITIPTSAAVKDYVDTATSNIGVSVISSNTTAAKGNLYVLTANLTLTLPASPTAGDSIKISNRSGVATCIVARNGSNIMGAATDLTLDNAAASFELIYSDATNGWVIIGPQ